MRAVVAVALGVAAGITPATGAVFDFATVVARAKHLAAQPYRAPQSVPESLQKLNYDQYRAINYKSSQALWPKRRFHVEFFAPGYRFQHPVSINILDHGQVQPIRFAWNLFDHDGVKVPTDLPSDLGFAGFRLHFTGYKPGRHTRADSDEVIAFLGASYFRAKGEGEQYGASARGLALDTTSAHAEEFPRFREFWLKKPAPGADRITLFALLDSPSATGAYRFVVAPGSEAVVEVKATLFLRKPVAQLGLAPLTSMYFYGKGDDRPPAYLRPSVHDSQGLLIQDRSGRWLWRQLANPEAVSAYSFSLRSPRGFGLMQRDRDFVDYQSVSMAYQVRPSVWVTPEGRWGKGRIILFEIPSANETSDNVVAFWSPQQQYAPHTPIHLAYRLRWGAAPLAEPVGRVTGTFISRRSLTKPTRFLVNFKGGSLPDPSGGAMPKATLHVGVNGKLLSSRVERAPELGAWRLDFTVQSTDGKPVQLRAFLARHGRALTETWDYVLAK